MANRRLLLGLLAIAGLSGYALLNSGDTLLQYVLPRTEQPAASASPTGAAPGAVPAQQREIALNPLRPPAGALSEMVERPLFNPTRAQRIEEPPPPPPEPVIVEAPIEQAPQFDPADYTLLGVVASADLRTAMIRANKTDEVFHVSAGERLMDLTVEAVDAREVTLRLAGETYKLKLFENPGQRNPAPPEIMFQQQAPLNGDGSEQ